MTDWTGTPYEPRPVTGDESIRHRGSWGRKGKCAWPYSAWCCCPSSAGPWRIGNHYGIHVYEGDRPVATFLRAEDADRAVAAVNEHRA